MKTYQVFLTMMHKYGSIYLYNIGRQNKMKFLQWLLYGAVVIQYVLYSLFVIAIIGIVIFLVTSLLLI